MAITQTDIYKIGNKYVKSIAAYLTKKKYELEPSLNLSAMYNYILAKYGADCLTLDQECKLLDFISDEPEPTIPPGNINLTPCSDQISIILLEDVGQVCNLLPIGEIPLLSVTLAGTTVEDDSFFHTSYVNYNWYDSCSDEEFSGSAENGNIRTGPFTASAPSDEYRTRFGLKTELFTPYSASALTSGYIKSIEVLVQTSPGVISKQTIDISPPNVALGTWTGCPTCEPVDHNDLYFISDNDDYATEMEALLRNVSRVLTGELQADPRVTKETVLTSTPAGFTVTIDLATKNNPLKLMSFSIPGISNFVYNDGIKDSSPTPYGNIYATVDFGAMAELNSFVLSCGGTSDTMIYSNDLGTRTTKNGGNLGGTVNFGIIDGNFVNVLGGLVGPIQYETQNTSCNTSTVTAIVTPSAGMAYSWYIGELEVSTTASVEITFPGTYTLTVTAPNGCTKQIQYTTP